MTRPVSPHIIAQVLRALPGNRRELEARTGLSASSVLRAINALCRHGDPIHISGWAVPANGGPATPRYALGLGPDTPCRVLVPTGAERCRQYRERLRASGEWEDVKAARRARYWTARPAARRDPLMVGLFGGA